MAESVSVLHLVIANAPLEAKPDLIAIANPQGGAIRVHEVAWIASSLRSSQ
jgi:hypothetical protein